MGSGKILKHAIAKYGIKNFTKTYLQVCNSSAEMFELEANLVNKEFVARKDTYNLKEGGFGGFDYINANALNNANKNLPAISQKLSAVHKGKPNPGHSARLTQWHKDGKFNACYFSKENPGKNAWTLEASQKRASTNKKNAFQQGTNNSQYGTCWIWHELIGNKKIKKDKLPAYIEQGWMQGKKEGYLKRIAQQNKRNIASAKKQQFVKDRAALANKTRALFDQLGYTSIRAFVRDKHYNKSVPSLINLWNAYLKEYPSW